MSSATSMETLAMGGLKGNEPLPCFLMWWPWLGWGGGTGQTPVLRVLKEEEASAPRDVCLCQGPWLGPHSVPGPACLMVNSFGGHQGPWEHSPRVVAVTAVWGRHCGPGPYPVLGLQIGKEKRYETVVATSFFDYIPNKQVFRNLRPEGLGQPMRVG